MLRVADKHISCVLFVMTWQVHTSVNRVKLYLKIS